MDKPWANMIGSSSDWVGWAGACPDFCTCGLWQLSLACPVWTYSPL